MSAPFRKPPVIPGLPPGLSAYVLAAGLVLLVFGARLLLQPEFGGAQTYSLFYPAVIIASYLLGRGPGLFATVAAAVAGFYCFSEPQFSWKATPATAMALAFFLINATTIAYAISGLVRALDEIAAEQGRTQAVANSHADLFRELNERVSHHLRLVAGVLTLQAKGEPEADVLRSLRTASERSITLARVHRELAGGGEQPVDFGAFAQGLVRSVCLANGQPAEQAVVDPTDLWLPPEEATSLGVALVECVGTLLAQPAPGALRVRILPGARETRIAISRLDPVTGVAAATVANGYLLRAMVEQLGAGVSLRADGKGSALELFVPHVAGPRAAAPSAAQTLH